VNTHLAVGSSLISTFLLSSLADNLGRFNLLHIQTSSLAGGVCIAALVESPLPPWVVMALGTGAGLVSTLSHLWVTPLWLEKRLRLYDCGVVHSVHGMPGVLSVLASCVYAYQRGGWEDGGVVRQASGLGITLLTAVMGGLLCGWLLNWPLINQLQEQPPSYEDRDYYLHAEINLFGGNLEALESGLAWIDEFSGPATPINNTLINELEMVGGDADGRTRLVRMVDGRGVGGGKWSVEKKSTLVRNIY